MKLIEILTTAAGHQSFFALRYPKVSIVRSPMSNMNYHPFNFSPDFLKYTTGVPEVKRLETSRKVIFDNVRYGFAAAYEGLVPSSPPGKGWEIALEVWPDSILDSPPVHLVNNSNNIGPEPDHIKQILDQPMEPTAILPRRKRDALVEALLNLQSLIVPAAQ